MSIDTINTFEDLQLSPFMLSALNKKGFTKPSPIQQQVIPLLLKTDQHVIGQAQTGTGKTAAFGIPLVERIDENLSHIQAIVLTPTRELCLQVYEEVNSLKDTKKLNIVPVYGGQSISLQISKLKKKPHIIIGTPGRVIDHLERGNISLTNISFFVLDEADEMFSMGFQEDIEKIMKFTSECKPQILLFSATFPKTVQKLVNKYIPQHEKISVSPSQVTTASVEQKYYSIPTHKKFQALTRIIDTADDFYGIVFCQTKVMVQEIAQKLIEKGYKAADIHGDLSQSQREIALKKFKKHQINILVATDVAARGIDVQDLSYVVNYSLPQDPEAYVHRIGRTGRAGKEGIAISLVSQSEFPQLLLIKRITKTEIPKENLPDMSQFIHKKIHSMVQDILKLTESTTIEESAFITTMTTELSENFKGQEDKLVTALLKYFAGDILMSKEQNDIYEEDYSSNSSSQRIFIALGKQQGSTKESIAKLLFESGCQDMNLIQDILVLENFSFATLPLYDAHAIVKNEKKFATKNKKPLITLAKNKDQKGSGSPRSSYGRSPYSPRNGSGGGRKPSHRVGSFRNY